MIEEGSVLSPSPTKECSKSIQAIDREAVHRICSGQVVLNLATAVKELVENSLDAGATSIEIRLREYGSELVEVVDNGCGVEETNYEGLTLKHHTSKLKEFADLLGVETFGFRGEALSSLCALSELTVTTRHTSSQMGTKLTYDSRGVIISKTPCARQVGTTVSLANLFSPLPVRQKEFLRNLKREFLKMSQLLQAYCLISTGVKILCSNQTKKGGKLVVVSTQGSPTYKGNIMCIFGAKQANSLLDIELEMPSTNHLEEIGLSNNVDTEKGFELEGCISSCTHGQGRSSTDRQFYYINNRPCDPTKVSKVVNEVYHQFNLHQFPFVFLNIKTARDGVDVNVTPDKRQIFLDNEKLLVATVKSSLLKLFDKVPNTYKLQNISIGPSKNMPDERELDTAQPTTPKLDAGKKISSLSTLLKNFSHSSTKTETNHVQQPSQGDNSSTKANRGVKRALDHVNYDRDGRKQLCLSDFVLQRKSISVTNTSENPQGGTENVNGEINSTILDDFEAKCNNDSDLNIIIKLEEGGSGDVADYSPSKVSTVELVSSSVSTIEKYRICEASSDSVESASQTSDSLSSSIRCIPKQKLPSSESNSENNHIHALGQTKIELVSSESPSHCLTVLLDDKEKDTSRRKSVAVNVNIEKVRALFHKKNVTSKENYSNGDGRPRVRFYAEIDPSKNKSAEQELSKEISKEMFSKMEIIGQFNLGFIITRLAHDLFIVDQHATDEKYNFETLQAQTTLKNQKLVIPQALDLTAVNECILMDNLEIFIKNGFNFVIDGDAEPTKRVRLAAKPISHNWEFGKEDIDELLFMLQDSPHTMCRPSRVRAMFASRACRKSVMIGTALNKSTMRQLVNHMGEIEQPWNCPHGRPTMRHLVNLELVRKRK